MPDGDRVCIGDSGGPVFLGDGDEVVGITLGTLGGCISSGTVTQMRVDTREARAFIGEYVTLP